MNFGEKLIEQFRSSLDQHSQEALRKSVNSIVEAKRRGGKVMVVTGSGPNIHEGVTTLIAELIHKGVIDAVSTSSAVVSHEMGGSLDRVFRVNAEALGMDMQYMPRGDLFEISVMNEELLSEIKKEMIIDEELMRKATALPVHSNIIKAAGNMAYPMGLRGELIAGEILQLARLYGMSFEQVAGFGCDRMTMIGACAEKGFPLLVTIPQLIGGGAIGMAIGDSLPVSGRSMQLSRMLAQSDVIIESAVALTQEIHDGPFECYTGHGIWAWWQGQQTYSLKGKTLVRFDLDENLRKATEMEKTVQEAIDKGLPKTKVAKIPFRMEMSAFARHEGSLPVIGDIGKIWPVMAHDVCCALGLKLDFLSASQDTPEGQAMRDWIVDNVKPLNREKMVQGLKL
ncbi:MAG: hypothetical protein FWH23_03225 [Bacteroidales bacterium]|nr:hypothetical protein [Bacteroidales bacterium]MCL2133804.1 hypothetical protein [Bacteroidales bacterium]